MVSKKDTFIGDEFGLHIVVRFYNLSCMPTHDVSLSLSLSNCFHISRSWQSSGQGPSTFPGPRLLLIPLYLKRVTARQCLSSICQEAILSSLEPMDMAYQSMPPRSPMSILPFLTGMCKLGGREPHVRDFL